ncbi:MAG: response regulator [Ardenticatenaceae bacterium]|nr:response regulator [Ardenticatenaceae bacterium]
MDKARVLLADDHAVVRAGIRNALDGVPDLEVVGEVGDGITLIEALEQLHPNCLLIDVTMPDFEPIATIRRIRARYPDLCILVVSAYDDDVYVQGLLSAGVNGYHLKDQSLNDLRLAVVRVLSGERWISSPLLDKLLTSRRLTAQLPRLSSRQRGILRLLVEGYDNRAMAQELNLSVKTIENHLTRLYRQLDVPHRLAAANFVREHPELLAHSGEESFDDVLEIEPPINRQTTILVVDDNKRYRSQLRRLLGRVCPQAMIYEAGNTEEALHFARQVVPWIVFVDVVLADEDGIVCARRLKSELPASRIIMISAYPDREFHRRGLQAGATAFLDKKDLDASALRQIVEDAVA